MTLTPPTVNPVTVDIPANTFRSHGDIQPFTYRNGMGYTLLLETMRKWLYVTLVPYLNTNFEDITDSWITNVTAITTAVDTALAAQATTIDDALAAQQQQVADQLAQTLSEITSGENAALSDAAVKNALQVAASTSLAFLATQFAPVSTANRFDVNRVNVWEHGLVCDGTTNDGPALVALIGTFTVPTVLRFPVGKTVNLGTSVIPVDVSQLAFEGDATQIIGTPTINLFTSTTYSNQNTQWRTALRGLVFHTTTINIGHATYTQVGKFRIVDGGMLGGALNFISNSWKIVFHHFHTQGTAITTVGQNTGENMIFRDCMLTDGTSIDLGNPSDWHFTGCSLDNMTVNVHGGAMAVFNDAHFEANGGSSARLVRVQSGSAAYINNSQLVIDQGTGDWTMSPFLVDDNVVDGGIFINGIQVPLHAWFKPETTDTNRLLVAGKGSAHVENVSTYEINGGFGQGYGLSYSDNLIRNGGSEEASSAGWTISPAGAWLLDTGYKHSGNSSHKIQANSGTGVTMWQEATVRPGRNIWAQFWQAFNPGTGGSLNTQIDFYDKSGSKISTAGFTSWTVGQNAISSILTQVPRGAATARFTMYLQGGTAGVASMNLDDVIINCA